MHEVGLQDWRRKNQDTVEITEERRKDTKVPDGDSQLARLQIGGGYGIGYRRDAER